MATVKQKKSPFPKIRINNEIELECLIDADKQPTIIYNNHKYKTLHSLLEMIPALSEPQSLQPLAYVVNFFAKGFDYQYIENIKQFKDDYLNRIEFEKNSFDYMPDRLIDHGVFNVVVMHPPLIINNELVFFVKNIQSGLPFKVSCPFPITSEFSSPLYQLLPYSLR